VSNGIDECVCKYHYVREGPLGGVNPPTTTTTVWGGLTPPKLFKSINQRVLGGVNPPEPKNWTSTTGGG
jgi:hypothetical protein